MPDQRKDILLGIQDALGGPGTKPFSPNTPKTDTYSVSRGSPFERWYKAIDNMALLKGENAPYVTGKPRWNVEEGELGRLLGAQQFGDPTQAFLQAAGTDQLTLGDMMNLIRKGMERYATAR